VSPGLRFSAFVGRDEARLALALCRIDPGLGGCLLVGGCGSGKSALARSLERLDPVAPFVTLPLGVSEDRLLGESGLLARARGGTLFIDDAQLLPPSAAALLLDPAEGRGYTLLATVNPEEGGLGPQLLDRFGLSVPLQGLETLEARVRVARRVLDWESDPPGYREAFEAEDEALAASLREARARLAGVELSPGLRELAARLAHDAGAGGSRGELALARAARALAAYRGRDHARVEDLEAVAPFALGHRRREAPSEDRAGRGEAERPREHKGRTGEPGERPRENDERSRERTERSRERDDAPSRLNRSEAQAQTAVRSPGQAPARRRRETPASLSLPFLLGEPGRERGGASDGRRGLRLDSGTRGRHVRPVRPERRDSGAIEGSLAIEATVRAALLRTSVPGSYVPGTYEPQPAERLRIEPEDARVWLNARRTGGETVFLVDASGSMGARRRMGFVKAALAGLLDASYRSRDEVAVLGFRDGGAETVVPRTRSLSLARARLDALETGGRTPLSAGLALCGDYLVRRRAETASKPGAPLPSVVVVTDGRVEPVELEASLGLAERLSALPARFAVVDCETGWARSGGAARLAAGLGARHVLLEDYL